jgi:hypothetical protein
MLNAVVLFTAWPLLVWYPKILFKVFTNQSAGCVSIDRFSVFRSQNLKFIGANYNSLNFALLTNLIYSYLGLAIETKPNEIRRSFYNAARRTFPDTRPPLRCRHPHKCET